MKAPGFAGGLLLVMGVIALSTGHIPVVDSDFHLHLSKESVSTLETWLYVAMAVPFAMMPILRATGTIKYYYETDSKYIRAKAQTIFGALCVPSIVIITKLLNRDICAQGLNCKMAALIGLFIASRYAIGLFRTIRGPKEEDDT